MKRMMHVVFAVLLAAAPALADEKRERGEKHDAEKAALSNAEMAEILKSRIFTPGASSARIATTSSTPRTTSDRGHLPRVEDLGLRPGRHPSARICT